MSVDDGALFKGFVQFQLADHRAQGGLRQLRDGGDVVAGAVTSAHRIGYLEVKDAVHLQLCVVAGNAHLAGNIQRNLFQHVFVSHFVDEWHQEIQPRRQRSVVFAQALHHPRVLLRHHFDGLPNINGSNDGQNDSDFHD